MTMVALTGARIVTPDGIVDDSALLIDRGRIVDVVATRQLARDTVRHDIGTGWLLPGFIDVQVNGGGDTLFNDCPDATGLAAILQAHRRYGTTGLLATLVSDAPAVVARAVAAVDRGLRAKTPGLLGIHVEGPHLNREKRGIHDPAKIVPMKQSDIDRLCAPSPGVRLVTLAPEACRPGDIAVLAAAGVIVSAGHSLADYAQTLDALTAGVRGFTHLFNAMNPLAARAPGMAGAAIDHRASWFGIIADGLHVHPAMLRIALAAGGLGRAMLVTDAMPPVGGTGQSFVLAGVKITVENGACRGPDGTLAGSVLTMAQAFRNTVGMLGVSIPDASRMASGNPARFIRLDHRTGAIVPGLRADLVHLDDHLRVRRTWIAGNMSEDGESGSTKPSLLG